MNKEFNSQFATQKLRQETTATNFGGATFITGQDEQSGPVATKKVFKKKVKKEVKDVEPKLAAGKAKIYMKDKWGWKDAPSIPNRPSKSGFIYKQLFEELSEFVKEAKSSLEVDDVVKIVYGNQFYGKIGKIMEIHNGFVIVGFMYDQDGEYLDWDESLEDDHEIDVEEYSMHSSDVQKIDSADEASTTDNGPETNDHEEVYETLTHKDYKKADALLNKIKDTDKKLYNAILDIMSDIYPHDLDKELRADIKAAGLNENYSKFKTETKTRNKPDQFHQAVRAVKKKVQEINRLFEYVSRLKSELSEGENGLKYKIHTEKALAKIKDMVNELNKNIKKFK